jgi:sugar lactone lactonase YvrE
MTWQSPTRVHGFSNNQYAAIAIGEGESPSYGVMDSQGGIVFDSSGDLWIADSNNNRVLSFHPPFSDNMGPSLVLGQPDFSSTEGGTSLNSMSTPIGVAFDSKGDLWVADTSNDRVIAFKPPFENGMAASIDIGQLQSGVSYLSKPSSIAFDLSGNLWISDISGVLEFRPPFSSGMTASLEIGNYYCNQVETKANCENRTVLNTPQQLAFDAFGDLWVTEDANSGRLLEFRPPFMNGMKASLYASLAKIYPSSLAFDATGNLWVGCRIAVCGQVFEFRPPFSDAMKPLISLGGNESDVYLPNVMTPAGLAFDSVGNLWVVDFRQSWLVPKLYTRILAFNAQVHSVNATSGTINVYNQAGLLSPLLSTSVAQVGSMTFPDGLLNFTIQGLSPSSDVNVTIAFSRPLSLRSVWIDKNGDHWSALSANQTLVRGSNLTLTFTNASQDGVISVFGGLSIAASSVNSTEISTATTSTFRQTPVTTTAEFVISAIVAAIVAVAIYRIYRTYRKSSG